MTNPKDTIQSDGRKANAAQPLNAAKDQGGAERYPATRKDEAVEGRGFAPNPQPRQGAGDGPAPAATNAGRLGPGADPAEGKR